MMMDVRKICFVAMGGEEMMVFDGRWWRDEVFGGWW